ncbi:hypothetical protein ABH966_000153 [Lysinibacillus sp. RC46]|uniref:hypothetical protein n=1 Tax=Lysinibacillus sp. RC46 TaxID=3156295 RepID=UPI003514C8C8
MVHINGIKSEVKTIPVLGTGIVGAPVTANLQKHKFDITRAGLQRFQRAVDKGHGDKDMAASRLAGKKGE